MGCYFWPSVLSLEHPRSEHGPMLPSRLSQEVCGIAPPASMVLKGKILRDFGLDSPDCAGATVGSQVGWGPLSNTQYWDRRLSLK
ncbi:hypothetical protein BDZ45DRAFT_63767 [Acephala macrosclerotiorum]|nr:hypothetical protein BDZ45DRAFT_63767 [Acephala macrosclerotiorum]